MAQLENNKMHSEMFIFPRLVESIMCGHQLNSMECLIFNMAGCENVNFYIKRYKCESQKNL